MKKYMTPVLNVVQFKLEERIAQCNGRCSEDMTVEYGGQTYQFYALSSS